MKLSLDELTALKLVLEFVSVKDLLTSAMNHFAEQEDTHSKDNADLCFKAITSFLKQFISETVHVQGAVGSLHSSIQPDIFHQKVWLFA